MEKNIQEFTITKENRGAIGFTNNTEELVIPEFFVGNGKNDTVEGQTYQVTEIGFGAFCYCNNLQKVVMPDSIVKIQNYAFANDPCLEEIHLSKNVKEIGRNAFFSSKLRDIHLPKELELISSNAFSHCRYLETVDTSKAKKLKIIDDWAFAYCKKMKNYVFIPKTVQQISCTAFSNIENALKVIIDKPKNSIPGVPWGAEKAYVYWIG